jgi:cell division protease FtsH
MIRSKDFSERIDLEIDAEFKQIIDVAFNCAKGIIDANRDKLELIANSVLEYETLEGKQVEDIVHTGKFTPPPVAPPSLEPPRGAVAVTPLPEVAKPAPPELPGLGTPAPAAV